ncbi:MAG TPA: DUF2723 domain-containing protein [bacterium]|nr:DUF2723 domain-containing protein [bacterium]
MPLSFPRFDNLLRPLLFLAAFAFLLAGVNPSFYADDSAETLTAAATLGIPHPPGYPLFTLLGRLFSLLPLGGLGFRVNLLSAILASLNCLLLFEVFAKGFGLARRLALPLSLFWVVGATSFPAALSAKTGIYELSVALLLAVVLALFQRRWEAAGLGAGLALANHWMIFLALSPGLWWFARDQEKPGGRTVPALWRALWGLAAGLSLYLFLPLRAARGPLLNWGDPVSWAAFGFDLARAQYQNSEANGHWPVWLSQAWFLLKNHFWEWPGLLAAAGAGLFLAWRGKAKSARGLALSWFLLGLALCLYLNLKPERFYFLGEYALAGGALLLILAGFAFSRLPNISDGQKFLAAGLALVLAAQGIWRFAKERQTDYTYAYDYALNSFAEIPAGGIFYARGDGLVFPAWYFQWVEGRRPDLAFVGVDGLPMAWIRGTLAKTHPDLHVPLTQEKIGAEAVPVMMEWMADKNKNKPLFISFDPGDFHYTAGLNWSLEGLVRRRKADPASPDLGEEAQEALWAKLRLRHWRDGDPVDGRTALFFANSYATDRNALGLEAEAEGGLLAAAAPKDFLRAQAAYARALRDYQAALEWYPPESRYAYNAGNALVLLGRDAEALGYYQRAWTLDPGCAEAYFNAAIAAFHLGQNRLAGDYFGQVLKLNPNYPKAAENLRYLVEKGWYHP